MSEPATAMESVELLALVPGDRQGDWLDACVLYGGGHEFRITQVASAQEMAAELRQYTCDLLLFWYEGTRGPEASICQKLAELADLSGFIALGIHPVDGWQHPLLDHGAVACLDMDSTDPRCLVHALRDACELLRLRNAQREWLGQQEQIRNRDNERIGRLLEGQQQLLQRLDQLGGNPAVGASGHSLSAFGDDRYPAAGHDPVSALADNYQAVLQNYLFDDIHVPAAAMNVLAQHFLTLRLGSQAIMRLHLAALTRITDNCGSNAVQHCLMGADRFLLELVLRLTDALQAEVQTHRFETLAWPATSPLAAA